MITIIPEETPLRDLHQILLSGVAPRPIALVSSMDVKGNVNLSPFSFFTAFGSNPPVVAIGPAHSAKTGKAKDTYLNIKETGECTINSVTYAMTDQVSLASCEYEKGTDEFLKSALTKRESQVVRPPAVAESPFVLECNLIQHIPLFHDQGGNGNILLLRVLKIHVAEHVFTEGKIDPRKMDLVARLGYNWYTRAYGDALFEVLKPTWNGIGMDNLPEFLKRSEILSASDLARLAGVKEIPQRDSNFLQNNELAESELQNYEETAKKFLKENKVQEAWQVLLLKNS
ncbi:MAG TPA: flavin reductase family protein [Patescibacteria group bacterium]|nr:flavin reductase family protein [Patescibacteria group bacterium]